MGCGVTVGLSMHGDIAHGLARRTSSHSPSDVHIAPPTRPSGVFFPAKAPNHLRIDSARKDRVLLSLCYFGGVPS